MSTKAEIDAIEKLYQSAKDRASRSPGKLARVHAGSYLVSYQGEIYHIENVETIEDGFKWLAYPYDRYDGRSQSTEFFDTLKQLKESLELC